MNSLDAFRRLMETLKDTTVSVTELCRALERDVREKEAENAEASRQADQCHGRQTG
jgi:hypothetical protein